MTMVYEHMQKGNPLFYWGIPFSSIIPGLMPFVIIKTTPDASNSIFILALTLSLWSIVPVLIWAGFFLSRLTVWIDLEFVHIRFGSGAWKKKFPLREITTCQPIKTQCLDGIGIHWVGSGWLYNIAAGDAVELTFRNGKKARIGTDQPEKLAAAIESAIKTK
jgi:hypothetical protein